MSLKIIEKWKLDISSAKEISKKCSKISPFKNLGYEQSHRASYFVEMSHVIKMLDLSNPYEKSALTLEPTHPVLPIHLEKSFDKLNISPVLRKNFKDSKLSLISLAMLKSYAPESDAKELISHGGKAPLYLLDPLYGFVFIPQKNRIGNHCFAIDLWSSHLKSMPEKLSAKLWENRADNMLSGGAFAGRLLFKDMIPEEPDPLKRSTPPIIHVNSESELNNLIDELRSSAKKMEGVELWFRGQSKDYLTPDRAELTKIGITAYSNIRDSDFTPSLYRKYDDFYGCTNNFEGLVLDLAEWVYHAKNIVSLESMNSKLPKINGVAAITNQGYSSYQQGLILQQYGAPSAYLDITSDHNVATWFATHSCSNNKNGKMVFNNYTSDSDNPDDWPTIFVFPLVKEVHPYLDLNAILSGSDALRPERQKCGLLGGSGNLARNYCARYLGLKIRLGPNFKLSNSLTASDLFPPESEDKALKLLKESGMADANRLFPLSELA
ncbi:hypothetical protein L2729_12710 [Shewanella gelidimarina]|uniref:hypothetical protein n=1 Tax=Shewanella gelidimarina TaxID=56813 RepID=UPI0020100430|nr:hypothetical protein [Shewanella gelidimarina]MCL1058843.1 hypothetical protein [Shewanella gelidimarina]